MDKLCPEQEICLEYSAGHKRKSHHVRLTFACIHMGLPSCPNALLGQSCDLGKMQTWRKEKGF